MSLSGDFGRAWWVAILFIMLVFIFAIRELNATDDDFDEFALIAKGQENGSSIRRVTGPAEDSGIGTGAREQTNDELLESLALDPSSESRFSHLVSGKVWVLDSRGVRHECQGGEFTLLVQSPDDPSVAIPCRIIQGIWDAALSDGDSIVISNANIDGRSAELLQEIMDFPNSGELDLEFQWQDGFLIHVTNMETQNSIQNVHIVRTQNRSIKHPGINARNQAEIESSLSPIPIDGQIYPISYCIGSRGYAWQSIQLVPGAPENIYVAMVRSSQLDLEIAGPKPPAGTILRLFQTEDERPTVRTATPGRTNAPVFEMELGNKRRLKIDGLRPGSYHVRAEIGAWNAAPLIVASVNATLEASIASKLIIEVDPELARMKRVPLSGLVFCDRSWQSVSALHVTIELIRGSSSISQAALTPTLQPTPGEPSAWLWDAGKVSPGRYQAVISPFQTHIEFVVPAAGLTDLRLDIGRQVKNIIVLQNESNGRVIKSGVVHWNGKLPEGVDGADLGTASYDAEAGGHVFISPAGEFQISTSVKGWQSKMQLIVAKASTTRVNIALRPAQELAIPKSGN